MIQTSITAVGNLITPLKPRHLPDGTTVLNFRIACNERRYHRSSEKWVDGDTFYVSVTCWRRLAENVAASFTMGDPIIVRGRIYTRDYDKDGRRFYVTELEADVVGPDLARARATIVRNRRASDGGSEPEEPTGGHESATEWAAASSGDSEWPETDASTEDDAEDRVDTEHRVDGDAEAREPVPAAAGR